MRIVLPSIQVPFIRGGANLMVEGLANALKRAGHEAEIVTAPFKFFPESDVEALMDFWLTQDFNSFNGYDIDKVIALQFPAYYVKHRDKAIWLMHQHRAVYDVYDAENASSELKRLKDNIHQSDSTELKKYKPIYTMSKNVSLRLRKYNDILSIPLYHPPYGEEHFYCDKPYNYIFYPSRLESHKRQDLLIQAMKFIKAPVNAIIAGVGGQGQRYQRLIEDLDLEHKVRLVGSVAEGEKYALYARSLAVFFGSLDEDYGYVTLEAMLSSKPVLTCTDSGGPLEFVIDGQNGFITEPLAEAIAERIDWLYHHRRKAGEMGCDGLELYRNKNISWEKVVSHLLNRDIAYEYQSRDDTIDFEEGVDILKHSIKNRIEMGPIDVTHPPNVQEIERRLMAIGVSVEHCTVSRKDYDTFVARAKYKKMYPNYYRDNFFEKTFEHFLCYQFAEVGPNDNLIDIGSEGSPLPEIFQRLKGCQGYAQDIMYDKGIQGNRIGSRAGEIPVPDNFFKAAIATCTIEHFEEDEDIRFMQEMTRVLAIGGKVIAVPAYLHIHHACQTDPGCSVPGRVRFDDNAVIYCAKDWNNRAGRFYSPETLYARLIKNNEHLSFKIHLVENAKDIHPSIYCRFILIGTKIGASLPSWKKFESDDLNPNTWLP